MRTNRTDSSAETDANNNLRELISQAITSIDKATPSDEHVDYKPLYFFLFNGITDVIDSLDKKDVPNTFALLQRTEIVSTLQKLHTDAEELYLRECEKASKIISLPTSRP